MSASIQRKRARSFNGENDGNERGRTTEPEFKSRWSGKAAENKVIGLLKLPTVIRGCLTPEQIDAYQTILRIEEITLKLLVNDVVPPDYARSPSPPPQYDTTGKRTNTREVRYKTKLEEERHFLVEVAARSIPGYRPPPDYRVPTKSIEKVYIPVKDYPGINFIGLLIGPRGNTLKKMEEESGAKIAIRGKGSVKDGKNKLGLNPAQNNLEEDLHCLITGDSREKISKAVKLCNTIIEKAASTPEGQNDLKRGQLRELAVLNGTLRETTPRRAEFSKPDYTQIICRNCHKVGHFARDCKVTAISNENETIVDLEYDQIMKDLNGDGITANDSNGDFDGEKTQDSFATEKSEVDLPPWKKRKAELPLPPWQRKKATLPPPPSIAPPPGLVPPPSLNISENDKFPAPPPGLNLESVPPPTLDIPAPPSFDFNAHIPVPPKKSETEKET